jgi:hypothetical protein
MNLDLKQIVPTTLKIFVVLFFMLMCYYHMLTPAGSGDEILFISDINFIKSNGWIAAIEKGIGLSYLILAYPLSFILSDYLALRITNMMLLLVLFFYYYKRGEIKNNLFYYYFLFICGFGFFLLGTNDTLFIVSMVIFFNEVYKFLEDKEKTSMPILLCALIVAFFTRQLVYIYLPVAVLALFLLWKKKENIFQKWYIPTILFLFFVTINIPSLEKNHRISYDEKIPVNTVKSTWGQRQYLAQLLVNAGKLPDQQHPSWEETDAYLLEHGENSLPKTTFDGIVFDFRLTILEFFKDFTSTVILSIRQTGLIFIIVISYLFYALLKRKITTNLFLPFVSLFIVATFSFIIISYVETRWLMVAYILSILYYSDLEINNKLPKLILLLNQSLLILVIFYGSYKVFLKL